ncbi:uncharacterized protein, PEP-CTERM system associated [Malonomonas rubra DSM 5091]|uniref:Uncharacterized protein, PEP-CTERM system associated n=1 Tax=Malonomonas rubra DSM 5091 TaxID=1122189 RepID=A0A1M6KEV9_MALRU|nr:outer membrane beta-barrel protein [Malonomonas rubra]SHJ57387.1 uncharacterized protein, PEP-CTERM system associated [Malonomonas rubra DSM 5091]
MKLRFSLILLLCFSFCTVATYDAQAKIKLSPKITFEEEYTDNLFLDHEDEKDEWITTVSPGVAIKVESRWIDLSLDYSFRYEHYLIHDELTDFDFEGGQRADLGTTLFEGRPFSVGINGTIRRETLDESENNSDANELINKSTVYDLTVYPRYRIRLGGQSSLVFGYLYDQTYHEDSRGDDYQGHSGRVSLIKELSTNTELSANYTYKINKSDDEDDYDRQSTSLGIKQQLGPRTTVELEGGYSTIEYSDIDYETEGVTWNADITYRLSASLTLELMFSQDFDDSSTNGLTESRDASFAVDYVKDSFGASLQAYWEDTDYVRLNREDESYGGLFSLSIPLYSNLKTGLTAEYETSEYRGDIDKTVDEYVLGVSFDYEISRFLTSLEYKHRVNDSDIETDVDDYTENTVTLSVRVRF